MSAAGPKSETSRQPLRGPFGGRAIYLGRVFNIDIGLDYSWIVIFLLVTYSLAQQIGSVGDWSRGLVWTGAVTASLLFFGSILLHELGHSVTSNALGIPIHSITLFIFGGVARLSREPDRPGEEFLIAVAGPAVSLVLGVLFLLVSRYIPVEPATAGVLREVFSRVGAVNLVILIFNCIPGFPLDGGRVLRSALWAATGDYQLSTRIAAAGGSVFAYVLIIGGITLALLGGAVLNGLWMAFIGWFLLNIARSSVTQMVFKDSLSQISVGEIFDRDCERVAGAMSVAQLVEGPILRQGLRTFFVETHGTLIGLVTLHEVKQVPVNEREVTPLQAIAAPVDALHSVAPTDTLWTALTKMDGEHVNQLPVIESGALQGVLTRESLLGVVRNQMELQGRSR